MDAVTFKAGVALLNSEETEQLQRLLASIGDPEIRHTEASVFIRAHVDPVELVRAATAVRAGLLALHDKLCP